MCALDPRFVDLSDPPPWFLMNNATKPAKANVRCERCLLHTAMPRPPLPNGAEDIIPATCHTITLKWRVLDTVGDGDELFWQYH